MNIKLNLNINFKGYIHVTDVVIKEILNYDITCSWASRCLSHWGELTCRYA